MAEIDRLHQLLDLIEEAKKIADKTDAQCASHLHMAKVEAERRLGWAVAFKARSQRKAKA